MEIRSNWKERATDVKFVFDDRDKVSNLAPVARRYYEEAVASFITGNFLASTALSSASVEVAINMDTRMKGQRHQNRDKWLNLSSHMLENARAQGLPVEKLLVPGEDLKGMVFFVLTRNKLDHGEIQLHPDMRLSYEKKTISKKGDVTYDVAVHEEDRDMALEQLRLAHNFLATLQDTQIT